MFLTALKGDAALTRLIEWQRAGVSASSGVPGGPRQTAETPTGRTPDPQPDSAVRTGRLRAHRGCCYRAGGNVIRGRGGGRKRGVRAFLPNARRRRTRPPGAPPSLRPPPQDRRSASGGFKHWLDRGPHSSRLFCGVKKSSLTPASLSQCVQDRPSRGLSWVPKRGARHEDGALHSRWEHSAPSKQAKTGV